MLLYEAMKELVRLAREQFPGDRCVIVGLNYYDPDRTDPPSSEHTYGSVTVFNGSGILCSIRTPFAPDAIEALISKVKEMAWEYEPAPAEVDSEPPTPVGL